MLFGNLVSAKCIRNLAMATGFSLCCGNAIAQAADVQVDGTVTGAFGLFASDPVTGALGSDDLVVGFTFSGSVPATVRITATGLVNTAPLVPLVDAGPDGFLFNSLTDLNPGRTRTQIGYNPLEEKSVVGTNWMTFGPNFPDAGALMGAFVPQATVNAAGFNPRDEEYSTVGISPSELFKIGAGPVEFTTTEPGTLFLGINDLRGGNNDGFFTVTLEPIASNINDTAQLGVGSTVGLNTTVDKDAVIGDDADIGNDVSIKKDVIAGDGLSIGDNTTVNRGTEFGDNVMVGENVSIGRDCVIGDNVFIDDNTTIGRECDVFNNVTIGSDVVIGREVEILFGVTVPDNEVIGAGVTYDGT